MNGMNVTTGKALDGTAYPAVKPLDVMTKIMRNLHGRTVIDPFMGTGSTRITAIGQGKIFTGIERNPKRLASVDRITAACESPLAQ